MTANMTLSFGSMQNFEFLLLCPPIEFLEDSSVHPFSLAEMRPMPVNLTGGDAEHTFGAIRSIRPDGRPSGRLIR